MLPSLFREQLVAAPSVDLRQDCLSLQEELIVRLSPGVIYVSVDLHLNGFKV